jgi:hypothetical protein
MKITCPHCSHEFMFPDFRLDKIHVVQEGSIVLCPACNRSLNFDRKFLPSTHSVKGDFAFKYYLLVALLIILFPCFWFFD